MTEAGIAQLVEQRTENPCVTSSNLVFHHTIEGLLCTFFLAIQMALLWGVSPCKWLLRSQEDKLQGQNFLFCFREGKYPSLPHVLCGGKDIPTVKKAAKLHFICARALHAGNKVKHYGKSHWMSCPFSTFMMYRQHRVCWVCKKRHIPCCKIIINALIVITQSTRNQPLGTWREKMSTQEL